ncbi:TetR/AcrR family transcriptional regulator [Nocardia thailandica]|uniref:TetR/AcrR family transcriptional regulator n=1 Tax=Nocardia thailandica TaxID=257275 RepID=UPI000A005181
MASRTQELIVSAAAALFTERGWGGTSMRDIAEAAGCSVEMVYAKIGNKAAVFGTVIDQVVVGDAEPVSPAQWDWAKIDQSPGEYLADRTGVRGDRPAVDAHRGRRDSRCVQQRDLPPAYTAQWQDTRAIRAVGGRGCRAVARPSRGVTVS